MSTEAEKDERVYSEGPFPLLFSAAAFIGKEDSGSLGLPAGTKLIPANMAQLEDQIMGHGD